MRETVEKRKNISLKNEGQLVIINYMHDFFYQ